MASGSGSSLPDVVGAEMTKFVVLIALAAVGCGEVNKGLTVDKQVEAIKKCESSGLSAHNHVSTTGNSWGVTCHSKGAD